MAFLHLLHMLTHNAPAQVTYMHGLPARAQAFAQTLQQSRGFGSEFRFPDRPAGATTPAGEAAAAAATAPGFAGANGGEEEDDLYS